MVLFILGMFWSECYGLVGVGSHWWYTSNNDVVQAKPKWLMVGSYPNRANFDTKLGGFFFINLLGAPFQLLPSSIYSEETYDLKHILVYTSSDLHGWDLDAVECRINKGEWENIVKC